MQWFAKSSKGDKGGLVESSHDTVQNATTRPRMVVAHFMLGNTYPFTDRDWETTFDLAEQTSLDALALNLGPEDWQLKQAVRAYDLVAKANRKLRLFISLDMNVLPHDEQQLVNKAVHIISAGKQAQVRWGGGILLSTFGGHTLGDRWKEVVHGIEKRLGEKVFFFPSFFLPPSEILSRNYVDGAFNWNGAWPMGDRPIDLDEDRAFLNHPKPYMAAVSPLFFTHYGTEGEWAWNKNWIYRSDDLLLPTRLTQLLSLPRHSSPDIIQIISWNDFGESHYIAPVLGAQPGSQRWTQGMNHEGFRWLVAFYARMWRDGLGAMDAMRQTDEVFKRQGSVDVEGAGENAVETSEKADIAVTSGDARNAVENLSVPRAKVIIWYRTQSKHLAHAADHVNKPDHAEWARDLINIFVFLPPSNVKHTLRLSNGPKPHQAIPLKTGQVNLLTVPFAPGEVSFEVRQDDKHKIIAGRGRAIRNDGQQGWNYNMWSGVF
ncbi:hypothetical protein IAU60_003329 [Kwoniella sp. DSM 27419]